MKIIDVPQGTPEWFSARCGIPSSSNFDKIVTMDGKPSKQREKYLYKLAGERVSGITEESYTKGAMQRGKEMEDEARKLYTFHTGLEVQQVGFCITDDELSIYKPYPSEYSNAMPLLLCNLPLLLMYNLHGFSQTNTMFSKV